MYYLGIDGGGTKTEFVLTTQTGVICARVLKSGCNPNDLGVEKSCQVLQDGIKSLLEENSILPSEVSIYAGVSGAGVGENAKKMTEKLREVYPCSVVKSDLTNAVETCLKGEKGIVAICGTGNSCAIYDGERYKVVGGYGYLFEEGGSGYAIGKDGAIAVLKAEDGLARDTLLQEYVYQKYGKPLRSALPKLLLGGKAEVGTICPLVFQGYENGDSVCRDIIEKHFQYVCEFLRSVKEIYGEKGCKIGFIGGITENRRFQETVKRAFAENEVVFGSCKPVYGAVRLAAKSAGKNCDVAFEKQYEQSWRKLQNA